ncbi:dTDP-4-dehydrorhamnose reductase [Pseudonocardia alni]|uniref:dTDP-4-dehydrorhamnose reductase n=1 Tax=Pseudonocardia alni TaxID=33907 RepID=UPI00279ED6A1|nr:dTDP-4-dehydrorhamnose reductase [Pseudonocardia alni]
MTAASFAAVHPEPSGEPVSSLPSRAIVVGASGQVGRALTAVLPGVRALTSADLDIGSSEAVSALDLTDVDVVLNAAAYTQVDRAEQNRAAAWRVNAAGVANLARATAAARVGLVHLSTEYVFDGTAPGAIPIDTPHSPLSVYGASKAAGELVATTTPRHWVVRTSWVVGEGGNFVRTMLSLAERGIAPSVVDDQIGRPTFADDLAHGLLLLLDHPPGIYHLTNGGDPTSWADLARDVFRRTGHDPGAITGVPGDEYFADKPGAAPRPANSVLDLRHAAALGIALPDWRESLGRYLKGRPQ